MKFINKLYMINILCVRYFVRYLRFYFDAIICTQKRGGIAGKG